MKKINFKESVKSLKGVGGIAVLLVLIMVITALINVQFLSAYNIRNIMRWTGLFGILSLGGRVCNNNGRN